MPMSGYCVLFEPRERARNAAMDPTKVVAIIGQTLFGVGIAILVLRFFTT